MPKKGTQKISFTALRTAKKPVNVSFNTKKGRVSFRATKQYKRPVRVTFYKKK